MKTVLALIAATILAGCSNAGSLSDDPNTLALQTLRAHGGEDSFLIILSESDDQHYIQFEVDQDGLIFDRPILAAHVPNFPIVTGRYYTRSASRPTIEGATLERLLSVEEAERAEQYLERWGLTAAPSYMGTEGDDGEIIGYIEGFHGRFTVPEDRFREFLLGYFTEVFRLDATELRLKRRTENS